MLTKTKNTHKLKPRKNNWQKVGAYQMSEKRLNNTIYLMYIITKQYCHVHNISTKEFRDLDKKHDILHYVSECPDVFDCMTQDEMVEEVDRLCAQI